MFRHDLPLDLIKYIFSMFETHDLVARQWHLVSKISQQDKHGDLFWAKRFQRDFDFSIETHDALRKYFAVYFFKKSEFLSASAVKPLRLLYLDRAIELMQAFSCDQYQHKDKNIFIYYHGVALISKATCLALTKSNLWEQGEQLLRQAAGLECGAAAMMLAVYDGNAILRQIRNYEATPKQLLPMYVKVLEYLNIAAKQKQREALIGLAIFHGDGLKPIQFVRGSIAKSDYLFLHAHGNLMVNLYVALEELKDFVAAEKGLPEILQRKPQEALTYYQAALELNCLEGLAGVMSTSMEYVKDNEFDSVKVLMALEKCALNARDPVAAFHLTSACSQEISMLFNPLPLINLGVTSSLKCQFNQENYAKWLDRTFKYLDEQLQQGRIQDLLLLANRLYVACPDKTLDLLERAAVFNEQAVKELRRLYVGAQNAWMLKGFCERLLDEACRHPIYLEALVKQVGAELGSCPFLSTEEDMRCIANLQVLCSGELNPLDPDKVRQIKELINELSFFRPKDGCQNKPF